MTSNSPVRKPAAAPRGLSESHRRDRDREVIRALVKMRAPALRELAKR